MSVRLQAIPVVYFEEGAVIIAHCVPLDVSSCGHDLEEARRNIRDAVAGFIEVVKRWGHWKMFYRSRIFAGAGENT